GQRREPVGAKTTFEVAVPEPHGTYLVRAVDSAGNVFEQKVKIERRPPHNTGWHGERLPPGMRLGTEKPVTIWDGGPGLEIEMVYVPPGDFLMGSDDRQRDEQPMHSHSLPEGYYIARYEVTVAQFEAFVLKWGHKTEAERKKEFIWVWNGTKNVRKPARSWRNPGFSQGPDHPVVYVSWNDAKAFCERTGLSLPTEAQWEKAARGEKGLQYPWGDEFPRDGKKTANVADETAKQTLTSWTVVDGYDDGFVYTAPVGTFPDGAAVCGALDMTGNVWEWCADWYDPKAYSRYAEGELSAPPQGTLRVARGGDWGGRAQDVRAANRSKDRPSVSSYILGFRPMKVLQQPEPASQE
ncbi:formylglycine-generating enzyme family protein, partial [Planctomycetota bacterium]